jgi:hypothetical protein
MAFTIPTAKQLAAQFLAAIEVRINQTTPPVARAFNRVLSVALAMFGTGVYKYVGDRSLQSLALTATGADLETIGNNYGVYVDPAVAAVLELHLTAAPGTLVSSGTTFTSDSTGETYTSMVDVTADGASDAILNVIASTPGADGNLTTGEILSIVVPLAGAAATATVTASDQPVVGEDRETETDYRRRVLTRIRAAGGGGNAADYRLWGEAVADVARVFPYSGKPVTFFASDDFSIADTGGGSPYVITSEGSADFEALGFAVGDVVTISGCDAVPADNISTEILGVTTAELTVVGPLTDCATEAMTLRNESLPGDRTVYVESISDPDDCPVGTLANVRIALNTDPETGIARMPLGLVDDRLYVESTYRTLALAFVVGLDVDAAIETAVKAKIDAALVDYTDRVCCHVGGLDFPADRTDTISRSTLSNVVQGILRGVGGSCDYVAFTVDGTDRTSYQLAQGELFAFRGATTYVTVYP